MCYHIRVANLQQKCGSGGTADALASGASGGNPVEVQILSTAPFFYLDDCGRAPLRKRDRDHDDLLDGKCVMRTWRNGRRAALRWQWGDSCGFKSHRPHQ